MHFRKKSFKQKLFLIKFYIKMISCKIFVDVNGKWQINTEVGSRSVTMLYSVVHGTKGRTSKSIIRITYNNVLLFVHKRAVRKYWK